MNQSNLMSETMPWNNSSLIMRNDMFAYIQNSIQVPKPLPSSKILFPELINQYDDSDIYIDRECRLYMAQSSIPGAGFGMFTARNIRKNEIIDPSPQIVIPLIDIEEEDFYADSVLAYYPWAARTQGSHLESKSPSIILPNLGMLANSHLGLVNSMQLDSNGIKVLDGVEDRLSDYSAGAISDYSSNTFVSSKDVIPAGAELFVDYGIDYFQDRGEVFNTTFPSSHDYDEADEIIKTFVETKNMDDGITDETRKEWEKVISDYQSKSEKKRVVFALPKNVEDVPYVAKVGTAEYSIPNYIRSIDWLEENGLCLDNLHVGKSNIPYAGKGAFAVRSLEEDEVIAPLPLVPIRRDELQIVTTDSEEFDAHNFYDQLLLNYCIGHNESSLLFFPYSSTVQYVNHSPNPNAILRWSESSLSSSNLLKENLDDVTSGLLMELVALREIEVGEEVTIDYGEDWSSSWDLHVRTWRITNEEQLTNPKKIAKELNKDKLKPIRTIDEQLENPYPKCIRTAFYHTESSNVYDYSAIGALEKMIFCVVIARYKTLDRYWYIVKMERTNGEDTTIENSGLVFDVPHEAMLFVPDRYCTDMHLRNSFRHEIQVPLDVEWPEQWLDHPFAAINSLDDIRVETEENILIPKEVVDSSEFKNDEL